MEIQLNRVVVDVLDLRNGYYLLEDVRINSKHDEILQNTFHIMHHLNTTQNLLRCAIISTMPSNKVSIQLNGVVADVLVLKNA